MSWRVDVEGAYALYILLLAHMNDYQVVGELGSGSFGRVVKVRGVKSQEVLAMKQIKMMELNAREKDNALNEVRLLASINCPNVISYKTAFFDHTANTLCILMEFADGGDLAGLIKKKTQKNQKINENFIWKVAYDILKGLKILHTNHIIHRDIKPANVFFVDGTAKLGDMNVSKVLDGKYASTQTGTPYYTSPEIWNNVKYDGRVDVWSLGCLLYELTAMKPPFMAKDFPGLSRKILQGSYDPVSPFYSKKLAEFIRRCLTLRMADRPTAKDLLKDGIFEEMGSNEEGEIELLDTIRCPKVLKMLQQKLPQCRSFKRIGTQKDLQKEEEEAKEGVIKSLKKIGSSRLLPLFINLNPSLKLLRQGKENDKLIQQMKSPLLSPNGYIKLPRINSHRNMLF